MTEQLLASRPVWELRAADIARDAGIAPATFYSYFESVTDAVLGVVEELSESTPRLIGLLRQPWSGLDDPRAFVEAHRERWNMHRAAFGARNIAADNDEPGFDQARFNAIEPILIALTERCAERQRQGGIPPELNPAAISGAFLAMLERMAAVGPKGRRRGVTSRTMVDAVAYIALLLFGETDGAVSPNDPAEPAGRRTPAPKNRRRAVARA